MKKFISIVAALAFAIVASAQNYEYTGPFGMPYVGVNAGVFAPVDVPTFGDFVNGLNPSAGFELGTYFTPIWGVSVEGLGLFGTRERLNTYSDEADPATYMALDRAAGLVNGKVNISNLLAGYKGEPRRVELVGVAGIGYGHNFNAEAAVPHTTFFKAGTELNVNLGQKKAVQINIRPSVLWNNQNAVYPKMSVRDANFQLTAGLTYKFGNRRVKSHNFVTNTYDAYQSDYDALNAKYNELAAREPQVKEVIKETVRTERIIEKQTKVLVGSHIITFPIGSCVLSATEKAKVEAFAKSLDDETLVQIVGSADSKTGSLGRNQELAKNRAAVVKNVLVKEFGIAESRISSDSRLDATDNPLTSRSAILTLSVD